MKVIKIGGNVIDNPQALDEFIDSFSKIEGPKVLVHGGGKVASKLATDMGIEVKMVEGRRITDDAMLDVVTMVYAGLVNKKVVAKLQAKGVNALGLTGADANVLLADKRNHPTIDFGNVGDVKQANGDTILKFSEMGIVPVFSAITHNGNGQLLNTNADTIASEVAKALAKLTETELIYVFELPGVMLDIKNMDSVVENINVDKYAQLKLDGIVADGMIPKLDNSFEALKKGVSVVRIASTYYINNENTKHTSLVL
ncbi:MAG: acetylglutamate kinase [Ichthyobacteriaceae bacterium]|nr:acetylglutamate kinase [Ichthyobacteriaceae bacterium]